MDAPLEIDYHSRKESRRILCQNRLEDNTYRNIINWVLKKYPELQPIHAFIVGCCETIAWKDRTSSTKLILYEQKRKNPLMKYFLQRLLANLKPTITAVKHTESDRFVESNVNLFKTIKKMMSGPAGFELLCQRMLIVLPDFKNLIHFIGVHTRYSPN